MGRDELRFNFMRNALYHTARRRVLEGLARGSNFAVLALGTTSAADALMQWGISQGMLGLAVAIVAALQFAFDWSGRARTHEYLQRRYYEGLAEIELALTPKARDLALFESRMSLMAAEEPPTYRALETMSYNEALDAIHGASRAQDRLVVPWWQVPLVHVLHFNGANYRSIAERAALKAERNRAAVPTVRPAGDAPKT